MRNAESVKARLKNIAKETGRTMQYPKRVVMDFPVILSEENPIQKQIRIFQKLQD